MAYTDIDDPSAYFQTLLYTGNGADDRALVNDGNSDLQPDWIWFKERNSTSVHQVLDSSRGVNKALSPNDNGADETYAYLSSFDSNGFTFDQSDGSTNENTNTFVAWQWKANGGTTASNTDGSITSTVQANTDAGVSILTYSANATGGATVGHGLGTTPAVVILKKRSGTGDGNWMVGHKAYVGNAAENIPLDGTGALSTADDAAGSTWNRTAFTSTVFTLGDGQAGDWTGRTNRSGYTMLAYCFAEKQGYSKFGSYIGNGSTDGTFVYTGFKPAWVLVKTVDVAQSWQLSDSTRSPFNVINDRLSPNSQAGTAESISWIDFTSNGFKLRHGDVAWNGSGGTYIYMAFAEHPFVSSTGVPTTAR